MKLCVTVLSLLALVAAFCSPALSAPSSSDPPTSCCLTYTTHKIPRQRIMDYYETNSQCSKPGIVFITKRNREVCTNPSDDWVQEYIKNPNLPLLPSRNLATVKIITAKNG
nr:C-C motif chemokine 4 isoform X2 [Chlorocebus sabaeus]